MNPLSLFSALYKTSLLKYAEVKGDLWLNHIKASNNIAYAKLTMFK